jgi:hypothetical protein
VIPIAEVGTDRTEPDAWAQAANRGNAGGTIGGARLEVAKARGYSAGSLDGIWVRGPFLQNASVPTLRHLLGVPEQRPPTLFAGNDLVDPQYVGLSGGKRCSPEDASSPLYDTVKPGNGNAGHLYMTNLSDADKGALLEFLKTL